MKLSIADACFPLSNQSYGMAAMWIKWHLSRLGVEAVSISDSDAVLVTCVDPRNASFLASIRKKYPRKKIIAGGAGAFSPHSLGLVADAVCVGNGSRFLDVLVSSGYDAALQLPEVWINGQTRSVSVAQGFPWDCPPIQSEDGAYRVWCGRGCKNKCGFCQTGWATTYEENPNPDHLIRQINQLRDSGKKIAYLSNDPNQHSFCHRLPAIEHGSYSVAYMKKSGLPSARQIRLGIEGPSERLRSLVSKPITHSDLVKSTAWLNDNHKSVRWFMIAGLPTETDADWEELKAALTEWKRICSKGVLALSFTAWQPEPSTPLGCAAIDDAYWSRWESFREWFFGGAGWSNRIKLMQPANPKSRLESAVARMGLNEAQLRIGGLWGPNDRVDYPYKTARNAKAKSLGLIQ